MKPLMLLKGLAAAREEGTAQAKQETARNLKILGAVDVISKATGLSIEEVEGIQ